MKVETNLLKNSIFHLVVYFVVSDGEEKCVVKADFNAINGEIECIHNFEALNNNDYDEINQELFKSMGIDKGKESTYGIGCEDLINKLNLLKFKEQSSIIKQYLNRV